jgi:hypothetical protein
MVSVCVSILVDKFKYVNFKTLTQCSIVSVYVTILVGEFT